MKRILRNHAVQVLIGWIGALYIRLVGSSTRWRQVGIEHPESFWRDDKPFILAFWHGRLLMMPVFWPRARQGYMLISQHRDGELITRTIGHFGFNTVRGSSRRGNGRDKGGAAALRAMVRALRSAQYIGVTPDGPRGPRMRVSDGIISLARLTGMPIIPISWSTSRGRVLQSWDRFLLPGPFGNGVAIWGEPIEIPDNADEEGLEQVRLALEAALNHLTEEADRACGRQPVTPAETRDARA